MVVWGQEKGDLDSGLKESEKLGIGRGSSKSIGNKCFSER